MNLVLSGPIDRPLLDAVAALAKPRQVVGLHARASRLVDVDNSAEVRAGVVALCDNARVDHAYIEEGKRFADFKLLAIDMDSTLITIECIDEIADFAGKRAEVAAITEATMRGEIEDFSESLRRRVQLLAGLSETILDEVYESRLQLSPGAEQLMTAAREARMFTILVSGGFSYFTDRLKLALQFGDALSNVLEIERGVLTGRLLGPIVDASEKKRRVQNAMDNFSCNAATTIVIGDGANDIAMMRLSNNSIAYHAKPQTSAAAHLQIKHQSLATVLDYFP